METENKAAGTEFVAVPLSVVNDILAFMQKKPYDEVAKLINDIHTKSRMISEAPTTEQSNMVDTTGEVVPEVTCKP